MGESVGAVMEYLAAGSVRDSQEQVVEMKTHCYGSIIYLEQHNCVKSCQTTTGIT